MTDQEKLARQWAENHRKSSNYDAMWDQAKAAVEYILEHTEPLTMEGREWVHAEHHMTGADWDGVPVVMIDPDNDRSTIVLGLEEETVYSAEDKDLTPNGKRYKLVETTEPDHPEVLETVEDYVNAPVGTIVEGQGKLPWMRLEYVWKETAGTNADDAAMAGKPRPVLRWGW